MSPIPITPPLPAESIINSLNPREAVHDTPNFRANVKKFEEQIDHFEKWLDALFKAIKSYSEESIKLNEASNNLAKKATLTPSEELLLDRDFTHTSVRIFADILQTTYAFKAKLVNDIDEKLLQPITHFIRNDLKEFKEARRNYERILERYDSMLAKYTSQSKTKEASALREDAFQLFEVRKNYIRIALDYTLKIVQFRTSIDHLVMEQFLTSTFIHLEMHEASLIVHKESENQLERLKGWLLESKKTCESQNPLLQDLRKKLEEEAINSNKPRRNLTKYTDGGMTIHPNSDALQTTRPPSPAFTSNETPAKQGYLFMRTTGKNTWTRKYFYLKDGIFWWTSVGHGKNRSIIEESERIGVLLCEVRIDASQDRRFCFEVVYGAKQTTYILQAETETELKDWISAFENAKRHALHSSNDPSSGALVIPNKETEDEQRASILNDGDHDTNKTSSTSSVEGYKVENNSTSDLRTPPLATISPPPNLETKRSNSNLLTKKRATSVSNPPSSRPPLAHHSFSVSSKGPITPLNNNNAVTSSSATQSSSNEKPSTSANQQNFWGTLQWAMPAVNLIMNTGNAQEDDEATEDGTRSKRNSGPVGSGVDGSINEYPHNLLLHNVQLHILFPCATEDEYVLYIFNCAWYKDNMLFKGRAYITQDKLYFYSTVMSVINMFWISWRDIKSIVYKSTDTQQIVEFIDNTNNHNYTIKAYLDTKDVFYEKAHTVWSLSTGEKSVSLQSIFNAVWKLEDGSKNGEKNNAVSEKNTEHKDENTTTDEKPLEKAEAGDQKNENSGDHKDLIAHDRKSVNDAHEKDNKIPDTPRTPSMIIIPSPEEDLPSSIPSPKDPIECHCSDHLEKMEIEQELPVSAKKLFDMAFDEKSTIWTRLHKKKGNTLLHSGPWVMDNGERKREFKFIMPVNNPMAKVKESNCIETQICKKRDDYLCYSVLSQTKALDIPYNDSFIPMIKFCITYISKTSCKLTCYIGIKWLKSPMVKAIIRKATMTGLSDTVADIMTLINADIAQRKLLDPSSPRSHSTPSLRRRSHTHRHHKSRSKLINGEELHAIGTSANKVSVSSPNEQKKSKKTNLFTMENLMELLDKSISTFIEIVTNLQSMRIVVGIILTLSLFFNIYLSMGTGYNVPSITATENSKTNVSPPAVYIRDIEEYVFNTSSKALKDVDPRSYRQFLDTRMAHPPYPWLLHFHRRMSDEISFARKKKVIGKRVYDLLSEGEEVKVGNGNDDNELNSSSDNEKHGFSSKYNSEYKSIIKYCKDVKKQLDVFS
ncbi:transcription factor SipA3, putative [Rhizophagus clarus]|uniref:Transcription factor SipA3, putative n=1 Tax=Rhizophagus clarus TaxID=94130 RepID=A0A8H3LAB4_9GLOM|nr:transcription factor SipA3, putative [Rhizophagus clarus]